MALVGESNAACGGGHRAVGGVCSRIPSGEPLSYQQAPVEPCIQRIACSADHLSCGHSCSCPQESRLICRFTFLEFVSDPGASARRSCSVPPRLGGRNPLHPGEVRSEYVDNLMQCAALLRPHRQRPILSGVCSKEPEGFFPGETGSNQTDNPTCSLDSLDDLPTTDDRDSQHSESPACSESYTSFSNDLPHMESCGYQSPNSIDQWDGITTLMLCGLSKKTLYANLVSFLEWLGFGGQFDLVHMPRGKQGFAGYAFVNFVTVESARHFAQTFERFCCSVEWAERKPPYLKVAAFQGYHATMDSIVINSSKRKLRRTQCADKFL